MNKAIFAAGCFWGVQEIFDSVPGVLKTTVGYTGGTTTQPTYETICTGTTNHAEAIEIEFDTSMTSFNELLKVFWTIHDPTTKNRQGPDIGTQYRSAIFFFNNQQKLDAEQYKLQLNKEKYNEKIVTEIMKSSIFYPAEDYHQNYNKKTKEKYGIS